jgi:transposase
VSTLDHTLKPEATTVHRLEVITGTGRRRRFSDDDKVRIVEETLASGAVVSEIARRAWAHTTAIVRMAPTSAPACRGECRDGGAGIRSGRLEVPFPKRSVRQRERKRAREVAWTSGTIGVGIDDVTVQRSVI